MQPFHHRDPGLVGLLGSVHNRPFYSIIVDGVHSHPTSVNITYKSHPKGIVLITDAIEAMGLPPGHYKLGTMDVNITKEGTAYISGTDTLAGSVVTMDLAVRNFKKSTSCSTIEALEAATLHPAQVLGIQNKKGTLDVGADADFVLLDDSLNVQSTYINGELAWDRNQSMLNDKDNMN